MSLRGSVIGSTASANPFTLALPAGSQAGDLAILFIAGAVSTGPSGWTPLYTFTTGLWNQLTYSKVLTSGDISAGSVSISNPFSFDLHAGCAVYIGGAGGVREYQGGDSAGTTGITNTTDGSVLSSDSALYWASSRSPSMTPTITPGSGSATTLWTATTANAQTVFAEQAMPGGVLAVDNGFNSTGNVAVQVIVESGLAPPGGLLVNPGMDGRMQQMNGGMNG
jgi:hypothetical protein